VATFIATLDDRIRSLARAHDQITADRWGPAPLLELIEVEASAYLRDRSHRIVARGENVLLYPVAYVTMALVIHELTTNAAKYGALADSGTVDLSWEIERESGDLVIDWRERDGPEVREPGHRGFGSTIIERSIPYDLGGTARVDFHRQGLHARFTLPARSIAGLRRRGHMAPCRSGPRADARRWRARTRCWSRTA
jgi:two-component sensor histidine kinase